MKNNQTTTEAWSPNDLDGSNGVKKQFIAKCHVEVGAGGFLRFPYDKSKRTFLDERLMAEFVEQLIQQEKKAVAEDICVMIDEINYQNRFNAFWDSEDYEDIRNAIRDKYVLEKEIEK